MLCHFRAGIASCSWSNPKSRSGDKNGEQWQIERRHRNRWISSNLDHRPREAAESSISDPNQCGSVPRWISSNLDHRHSRSTMPIARNDATNDEQNHQFLTLINVVGTSPTSKKSFYRRPLRNHRVAATARKRHSSGR